jgi:hypothetical protein
MAFQIVRLELDSVGAVVARRPTMPLFELHAHALAIAEFEAARSQGDYGYDAARDCWWVDDRCGRIYRFEIVPVTEQQAA